MNNEEGVTSGWLSGLFKRKNRGVVIDLARAPPPDGDDSIRSLRTLDDSVDAVSGDVGYSNIRGLPGLGRVAQPPPAGRVKPDRFRERPERNRSVLRPFLDGDLVEITNAGLIGRFFAGRGGAVLWARVHEPRYIINDDGKIAISCDLTTDALDSDHKQIRYEASVEEAKASMRVHEDVVVRGAGARGSNNEYEYASVRDDTLGFFGDVARLFRRRRDDTPGDLSKHRWAEVKKFKKYWKRSHIADAMEASWSPDARCPDAQNLYDPGSYGFGENGYECRRFTRRSRHHVPPLSLATIRAPLGDKTVITGRPGGNYLLPSSKVVAVASCDPVTNQRVLKEFLLEFIGRLKAGPPQAITRAIIDKQWQERTPVGGRMYVLMQVQNSTADLDFSRHKGFATPEEAVYERVPRYYCRTYVKGTGERPPFPFVMDEGAQSFVRAAKKGTIFINPHETFLPESIAGLWTIGGAGEPLKEQRFRDRFTAWKGLPAGGRMLLVVKLSLDDDGESKTWFTSVNAALKHGLTT